MDDQLFRTHWLGRWCWNSRRRLQVSPQSRRRSRMLLSRCILEGITPRYFNKTGRAGVALRPCSIISQVVVFLDHSTPRGLGVPTRAFACLTTFTCFLLARLRRLAAEIKKNGVRAVIRQMQASGAIHSLDQLRGGNTATQLNKNTALVSVLCGRSNLNRRSFVDLKRKTRPLQRE